MTIIWLLCSGRGTGLFTACYKSCWALSPEFLNCWATHCKCSCNLGLHITLWDLRTREMVLPRWYCCLSAVPWVTNCLSLIHCFMVYFWQLWCYGRPTCLCASSSPLESSYSLPSSMRLEFFPTTGLLLSCHSLLLHSEPLHTPFLHPGCPLPGHSWSPALRRAPH